MVRSTEARHNPVRFLSPSSSPDQHRGSVEDRKDKNQTVRPGLAPEPTANLYPVQLQNPAVRTRNRSWARFPRKQQRPPFGSEPARSLTCLGSAPSHDPAVCPRDQNLRPSGTASWSCWSRTWRVRGGELLRPEPEPPC